MSRENEPKHQSRFEPIRITSLEDERVAVYRDVRDKDLLGREKIFMAESQRVLRRLLARAPDRIESVLLAPDRFERLHDELRALPPGTPVYVADVDLMTEIAGFHIHRGVLAAGRRLHPRQLFLTPALDHLRGKANLTILVAERITNVDNMGALFRNAAACGVDAIALDPRSCDPLYRKAIRVSMGHTLSIPYGIMHRWPDDLERLKSEWGCALLGAEVAPDARPLWELPHHDRLAIMVGSEADGLSEPALAACDGVYQIPMSGRVPSLNVATASAVFLYERLRAASQAPSSDNA